MLIRPTSIIAHSIIESDLRQFGHTLNQEHITDIDCIIPITHKGQLTHINWKDLSPGMSPWSAYHRDWLTTLELDHDYLCQGLMWYRDVDDDGALHYYRFKGSQDQVNYYNDILTHFDTKLYCEVVGRYIEIRDKEEGQGRRTRKKDGDFFGFHFEPLTIYKYLSYLLGLIIVYGDIQSLNNICTTIKINLPITAYTRQQLPIIESIIQSLRAQGLFVSSYLTGSGMRQSLQLVCTDAELLQSLLSHLQYIDSSVTMTTLDTLQSRSNQVVELGLEDQGFITKPRTLD